MQRHRRGQPCGKTGEAGTNHRSLLVGAGSVWEVCQLLELSARSALDSGAATRRRLHDDRAPPGRRRRRRGAVVSRVTASSAALQRRGARGSCRARRGGGCRRGWSRNSAVSPRRRSSRCRRRARSSGAAVMKSFTSACGQTTVPMSRPSSTAPGCLRGELALEGEKRVPHRLVGRDDRGGLAHRGAAQARIVEMARGRGLRRRRAAASRRRAACPRSRSARATAR